MTQVEHTDGAPAFLAGGGNLGERMRTLDWGRTLLGPPARWPQSLKTAVRIMLTSRQPEWIGWGPELVCLYNDACRELIGGEHPRALGAPARVAWPGIWDRLAPAISTAMAGNDGACIESQRLVVERKGRREERSYTFSFSPLADDEGRVVGILCSGVETTRDGAEARLARQALEASERRFRMMADTAPAMLYLTERDGSCSFVSRAWCDYTGQREEEALGFGWIEALHPDDRVQAHSEALAAKVKREPFEVDYRVRRRDGEYRWAIAAGRPRFSETGEFLGYIGSIIDAHDRKLAEEALRESDRRKDEFLAMLAHELRNPLAPLRTGLEILRMARDDPELLERTRSAMDRQITHMSRLVDDLLDVSRISRGKLRLRKRVVPLAEVVGRAVEAHRPACSSSELDLAVHPPPEPLQVCADPDRVHQIVGNLLSNACKFTGPGGRIDVRIDREGEEAVVRVADTGVGLAPDQLEPIFELFAQVDRHAEVGGRLGTGLGIGLTLVKRLVELHGGRIAVRSEGLGHGSEFSIRLPLANESGERGRGEAPGASEDAARMPRRVLVVDDNADAADMLAVLLEHAGHRVTKAYGGLQALEVAERIRPEVVLLDIGLPGIDGYEVCRRIRATEWGREATLIAVTGWGQSGARKRSAEAGFDHHLVKPVDVRRLRRMVAGEA